MLGRAVGHYAIAGISQKAVGLILIPVTAYFLGAGGYGQLALLVAVANLGSIVAALGLPEYTQRYAYRRSRCHQAAILGVRWSLLLLMISPLLAWILAVWLPGDLHWSWLQWLMVNLSLGSLMGLRLVLLRVAERSGRYLWLVALHSGCHLSFTLLSLIMEMGPGGMMAAGAIATIVTLSLESGRFWTRLAVRRLSGITPVLAYSLPLALSLAATFSMNGYERPWLAQALSLEQLGAYALVGQLCLLPAYVMEPFMLWWGPKRHVLASRTQYAEIAHWLTLAAISLMVVIALAGLALPVMVTVLFDQAFHPAVSFLPWLLAATLFRQLSAMMNLGLYHRSTGNLPLVLNLILVLPALVLIPWAIEWGGAQGLVWLLLAMMVVKFLMTLAVSQYLLPLPYGYPLMMAVLLPLVVGLYGSPLLLITTILVGLVFLFRHLRGQPGRALVGEVK